jgi:hypothetical protein
MLLNLLGPYQFHTIQGPPKYTWQQISVETRDGLNGVSLWSHGVFGKPFQITTLTYTLNHSLAIYLAQAYQLATNLDPLPLIVGNTLIPGGLFQVLEVDPVEQRAIAGAVGFGVPTPCNGLVRAVWTLQPVSFPDP